MSDINDRIQELIDYIQLDPCEKEIMSYCNDLMNRLLGKYRRGRAEHGSNWQGIDCDKEMAEEVKDILNYHCIFNTQKGEK